MPRTAKRVGLILIPVVIVAALGGIWLLSDDTEHGSSSTGSVNIAPNQTVPSTSPFHLEGQIHYQFAPSQVDDASFEDVMLCLYDSNGDVIESRNLGTFDGSAEYKNISITTDGVPDLIIVHHPRFYSIDGFHIYGFEYISKSDRFRQTNSNDISFPYDQLEKGSCVPSP